VPVIAGAGSNNTREALRWPGTRTGRGRRPTRVTPYYNKPNQEGLYLHFKAINDSVSIPINHLQYPPRSVIDMSVETMKRLSELKNIVGVKDATGNVGRISLQREAMGPDFIQLSGDDLTALSCMAAALTAAFSVYPTSRPGSALTCKMLRLRAFKPRSRSRTSSCPCRSRPFWKRRHRREIWACRCSAESRRSALAARPRNAGDQGPHSRGDGSRRRAGGLGTVRGPKTGSELQGRRREPQGALQLRDCETFDAGLALTGTEVKSLRTGKATIAESYAHVDRKARLGCHATIPNTCRNRFNHEPKRLRKLLLKQRELVKLSQAIERRA